MPALVFPKIAGGAAVSQYPYTEVDDWTVAEASIEAGATVTRRQHDDVSRSFVLNFPLIQRDDVALLEDFFNECRGRLASFEFTDDQGTTWSTTRFDQEALEFMYVAQNHFSTTIKLAVGN